MSTKVFTTDGRLLSKSFFHLLKFNLALLKAQMLYFRGFLSWWHCSFFPFWAKNCMICIVLVFYFLIYLSFEVYTTEGRLFSKSFFYLLKFDLALLKAQMLYFQGFILIALFHFGLCVTWVEMRKISHTLLRAESD